MKAKLISVVTAAVMITAPAGASADYYPDSDLPDVHFSQLKADPISLDEFNKTADDILSAISSADEKKLTELFNNLKEYIDNEMAAHSLAYLRSSQHSTPENTSEVMRISNDLNSMSQTLSDIFKAMYDNAGMRSALTELCGSDEKVRELINSLPDERFYELSEQEAALIKEYNDSDPKDTDSLAHIFKKLVEIRNEQAKAAGYDNYADYAHCEIYGRDFTTEDTAKLRESVKKYLAPLFSDLLIMRFSFAPSADLSLSDEKIISDVGTYMKKISPELGESYEYMISHGFYDINHNNDRVSPGTAYTTDIMNYPFTFISTVDGYTSYTLDTLVHEFGHYNAELRHTDYSKDAKDIWLDNISGAANTDIHEIYSQGLELLTSAYYDDIYGTSGSQYKIDLLYGILSSVITGCIFDEWQEKVYKNPSMSMDEINKEFSDISSAYDFDMGEGYWTQVPHNYESPMYYISYAVSAVAALEIWSESLSDRDSAVDRYMKLTADKSDAPFKEMLSAYGFGDVFDESTFIKLAGDINDYLKAGYSDGSCGAWYAAAVFDTASYLDSSKNDGLLRADDYALRSELANTIGKFHERFSDIPESASPFTDAKESKYISWAAHSGIVNGYDAVTFGADDTVTREQAAAIIYRYLKNAGIDLSGTAPAGFADAGDISPWALEAVGTVYGENIINGIWKSETETIFNPKDYLTRAELAQIMTRINARYANLLSAG